MTFPADLRCCTVETWNEWKAAGYWQDADLPEFKKMMLAALIDHHGLVGIGG